MRARGWVVWGVGFMLVWASSARAEQQDFDASKSANAFLEIGTGARAVAMGEAFTAVADDVSSLYWNPAGLGGLHQPQILLMHNQWFQNVLYEYGAASLPCFGGSAGLAVTYLNYGTMDKVDEAGQAAGSFSAYDLGLTLGYGYAFSRVFSAGAAVKWPMTMIDARPQSSLALDAGALVYWPGWSNLQMGVTFLNLGGQVAGSQQPMQVKVGAALMRLGDHVNLALDASKHFFEQAVLVHGGVEYYLGIVALRAGYKYSTEETGLGSGLAGVTLGAGVNQRFDQFGLQVDYAFVPYGDLGATHRFALTLALGPETPAVAAAQPAPVRAADAPASGVAPVAKTAPARQVTEPLAAPAQCRAQGSGGHVQLTWSTTASPRLGYNVYQQKADGTYLKLNPRPLVKPSFRTGKLPRKKNYHFLVKTVDAQGVESAAGSAKVYLK